MPRSARWSAADDPAPFSGRHWMIQRYEAAGGVVLRGTDSDPQRVLLLERPSRGEFRLPKGHIDPGERAKVAALRETAEESGYPDLAVQADLGWQLVAYTQAGQRVLRRERYFVMRLESDRQVERPPADAAQFIVHWLAASEAMDRLSYASERNALAKALAWRESGT
jgi:8-oxo-dGTP pyrophosphatase MutT (NUDIX family)